MSAVGLYWLPSLIFLRYPSTILSFTYLWDNRALQVTSVHYSLGFIPIGLNFFLRVDCVIPLASNIKLLGNLLRCWDYTTQATLYILALLIDPATAPTTSYCHYLYSEPESGVQVETASTSGSCHPNTLLGTRHIPQQSGWEGGGWGI